MTSGKMDESPPHRHEEVLRRMSLRTAAFLFAALSTLAIAAAFSILGLSAVKQSSQQVLDERLLLARTSAEHIDYALRQVLRQLNVTLQPDSVPVAAGPAAQELYERLKQQIPLSVRFVSLLDARGAVLWNEPENPDLKEVDFASQPYVARTLANGKAAISEVVFGILPARPLIFFSVPIKNNVGGITGLAQVAIDPEASDIGDWVQPLRMGETGYGQIVVKNGIVLASTDRGYLFQKAEHGQQFADLVSRATTTVGSYHSCHEGPARRKDVLAFAPVSVASWGVAIQQSEEEAFAPALQLRRQLLWVGLAAFLTAFLAAWLIHRHVARPIRSLASVSRAIAAGDLSIPVAVGGPRELSSLGDSFEKMRLSLNASREQATRWQEELEQGVAARTRDLMSLVQASEALVSSLEPETVLKSTVEAAVNAFCADSGTLFLWDHLKESLVATAAVGYDQENLSRVRLKPGEGIAGRTVLAGEVLYSNDPAQAEAMLSDISEENRRYLLAARGQRPIQAFLCVPLVFRDRTLGSLFLASLRPGTSFSSSHVELAQTFARIASALLENLRLLQEASQSEALREIDRLKTDFLSNISHELQTPLAALKASLGFLSPTSPGAAADIQASLIENARRNADRLHRLVADLIDVARLQNLQLKLNLEPLDLREVVQHAVESLGPLLEEKGQRLETSTPQSPVVVLIDERRLEQALHNLVMNAHQYTAPGGRITITLSEEADRVVISVADTGPGIRSEERDRLFERFYRSAQARTGSGLGLGLAIAKGVVELHGGRIWVESELGRGSIFSFSLPKESYNEDPYRR